jgi:hypothetical protein
LLYNSPVSFDEISNKIMNSIAGVMGAIGLCAWSAVDHGFEQKAINRT